MKTEPVFTWFYSCNKSLRGQCSPVLPARDVGYSPCPTCGSSLLRSKSFGPKKTSFHVFVSHLYVFFGAKEFRMGQWAPQVWQGE